MTVVERPVLCWRCRWSMLEPRFYFASHLDWHLAHVERLRVLDEALAR